MKGRVVGSAYSEELSDSLEDYLEAIYNLELEQRVARAKDVAAKLKVRRSSVTAALKTLSERGYLDYSPYSSILLTSKGHEAAREITRRHEVLQDFLQSILGLPADIAHESACRMEHAIRGPVLERLLHFVEFFFACPRATDLLDEFARSCREGFVVSRCLKCVDAGFERLKHEGELVARTTLRDLEPGEIGIVVKIKGDRRFNKRIADMGVTSGCLVMVERVAPMGDPMQIKVRGYHLSIRKDDAASIIVQRRGALHS